MTSVLQRKAVSFKRKSPPKQIFGLLGGSSTYRHHVVALHVGLVLVLAFVVEFPEEVERHHGVEIDDHGQEAHGQHQLQAETALFHIFHLPRFRRCPGNATGSRWYFFLQPSKLRLKKDQN